MEVGSGPHRSGCKGGNNKELQARRDGSSDTIITRAVSRGEKMLQSCARDQVFSETGLDTGVKISWASMLRGEDAKTVWGGISNRKLRQLPAQEVPGERSAGRRERWK